MRWLRIFWSGRQGNFEAVESLITGGEANFAKLERCVREDRAVETLHVVEEISGDGGVRFDSGGLKAEIVFVIDNFPIDVVVDGDRGKRRWKRDF